MTPKSTEELVRQLTQSVENLKTDWVYHDARRNMEAAIILIESLCVEVEEGKKQKQQTVDMAVPSDKPCESQQLSRVTWSGPLYYWGTKEERDAAIWAIIDAWKGKFDWDDYERGANVLSLVNDIRVVKTGTEGQQARPNNPEGASLESIEEFLGYMWAVGQVECMYDDTLYRLDIGIRALATATKTTE